MALGTRIALTFLFLLAAVLTAALGAVSAANRKNVGDEVQRQLEVGTLVLSNFLENNNRLLTQAAMAMAADPGFRNAAAARDAGMLAVALQNHTPPVGVGMVVVTTIDGRVLAASGSRPAVDAHFPVDALQRDSARGIQTTRTFVDDGRIYQVAGVPVTSATSVVWLTMGSELDAAAAAHLAKITDLGVTLSMRTGREWQTVLSTVRGLQPEDADTKTTGIALGNLGSIHVEVTLSRSLRDASLSFAKLTTTLFEIAAVSLVAFAWAAFWIARTITRPLNALTRLVDQMRGGAYDAALDVQRGDELGVLAEGLERMQKAVRSRDQSIRRLAYQDPLTGLMNRAAFSEALTRALAIADGSIMAIALIDVHRFRRINEHLGYSVGDAVLIKIAERLANVPTLHHSLARLMADQFAAFTALADAAELQTWGTSLLVALGEPILVESQPIDISAAVGLAAAVGDSTAENLLRSADLALDSARSSKRPLAIFEESLKPPARDQLSLLGELSRAVEHDELRLFFQPKIDIATQRVAGAEVLLRWQHPTRGLLSPAAFIPFAEQTGFIRRLTRWTLDRAIAQGAAWHRAGVPLALAVNISADDLRDPRLDSRVAGLLTRHQLPPALLTLEVTESGFFADPDRALSMLESLAALGVILSIDDFGTGYSSLSHLARMPVHELKIDRSFVRGLETEIEFGAVVRSAIDMGHSLGLKIVAEGIETQYAADRLREFGCDVAQGYLYAFPLPVAELMPWLAGRERVPVIAVPVDFDVEEVTDTLSFAVF